MLWRNSKGNEVDPAPFIVTSMLSIMIIFSFGPIYGMEYGLDLRQALVVSTGIAVSTIGLSYRQLVWRARPEMRGEVPPHVRLQRIFYAVIAGVLLLGALTYPIVAGS